MVLRNSAIPLAEFRKLEACWWALDLRRYSPAIQREDFIQYSTSGDARVILCEVLEVASSSGYSAVFKPGQGVVLVRVLKVGML
jgi:hypothetical protein